MNSLIEEINDSSSKELNIFSVGQAGYIIKLPNNKTLGIDLYLSDCVERVESDHVGYRRLLPKLLKPDDVRLDYLICTHFHRDHFDIDSVPILMNNNRTKLFCAYDCVDDVEEYQIDKSRVQFVAPGDEFKNSDLTITFVNCDHGQGAPKAVGAIIEVENKRILFVGDTCLRLDRKEEYLSRGNIDVLVAPINGMYGNLNEKECASLASELNVGLVIPSHYGMFAAHRGDIGLFHKIMSEQYPNINYLLMCQGEKYSI